MYGNRITSFRQAGLYFFLFLLVSFAISCSGKKESPSKPNQITDDLGINFEFKKEPKKIISLAPNITEMIFTLGLEKHLVGDTKYCDYPEAAKSIEKVGDMLTFNFEKIVSLKPDLIFITVEGNTKETYNKFLELGLKVFVSNPRNYKGIRKTYSDISRIFSVDQTNNLARWDSTVNMIKSKNKFLNKSAMYVVELKPIMLVGKNTFINEYLEFCGLRNIAEDSPVNYPVFNREEILKRNPDYIIYPTDGSDNVEKIKTAYPEWNRLKAVINNDIIFVNRDLYSRPGPRFIEALQDLFNQLRQKEEATLSHRK